MCQFQTNFFVNLKQLFQPKLHLRFQDLRDSHTLFSYQNKYNVNSSQPICSLGEGRTTQTES
jgi:hypothetical protein